MGGHLNPRKLLGTVEGVPFHVLMTGIINCLRVFAGVVGTGLHINIRIPGKTYKDNLALFANFLRVAVVTEKRLLSEASCLACSGSNDVNNRGEEFRWERRKKENDYAVNGIYATKACTGGRKQQHEVDLID